MRRTQIEAKMSTGTTSAGTQGPGLSTAAGPFSTAELYRINVSEYERLVSLGGFDDSRLELIDGFRVRKIGKNPPHVWSVDATQIRLDSLLPDGLHKKNGNSDRPRWH
jgi:hypothetical protein